MMRRLDDEMMNEGSPDSPSLRIKSAIEGVPEGRGSLYETLRDLFSYRNHYHDNLCIIETYIAENNYRMALATIANMYKQFELSDYGKFELEGLQTYVQWRQELYNSDRNIFELPDSEIDYLLKYVESNVGRGVVFANNILCFVYHICLEKEGEAPQYAPPQYQTEDDNNSESVIDNTLQINNKDLMNNISIIPNPTTGEFKVQSSRFNVTSIEVFDVYGRLLMSLKSLMSTENVINISHLHSGIYFVKITTEQGEIVKKVVKQ